MKFKIVRVVSSLAGGRYGTLTFPPISLGILAGHVRARGFDVDQDDLHRRWYSARAAEETERLRLLASDEQRMWRYLEGQPDDDWEWFGDTVTALSDFESPDAYLLSLISSDIGCCVSTLAFSRYLKRRYGRYTVVGGEYFAYAPIHDEIERVLALGVIDYYVLGYGEESLERLLPILTGYTTKVKQPAEPMTGLLPVLPSKPVPAGIEGVPGLRWLDTGNVRRNPMTPNHALVPPDFDGLPIDLYRWTAECDPPYLGLPLPKDELTLPFHLNTGCPYNCSFCECSGMRKVSILPPEQAVTELKAIVDKTGCRTFFFLDNTLNLTPRYVHELCDRIIDAGLNIQWMDCASGNKMDFATLKKMRQAGVIRIVWGLESGSDRILEYVDKPVRTAQAGEVLAMAHEAGIWNGVEIIVGMPGETDEDFDLTMKFLAAHHSVLDEVWTYQFYLNSNSAMFTNTTRFGIENVRRVNIGLTKDAVYGAVAATHIFDETNGLRWAEKEGQQKRRLAAMLEHVAGLGLYPMTWEHEQQPNLLSWCYRHAGTKTDIRQLYRRYWEKLYLRRTWGPLGRHGDSADDVAYEIFREYSALGESDLDRIWRAAYPEKWLPFYAESEYTPELTYETSLLIDGRYHDRIVYQRLQHLLQMRASAQSTAVAF